MIRLFAINGLGTDKLCVVRKISDGVDAVLCHVIEIIFRNYRVTFGRSKVIRQDDAEGLYRLAVRTGDCSALEYHLGYLAHNLLFDDVSIHAGTTFFL